MSRGAEQNSGLQFASCNILMVIVKGQRLLRAFQIAGLPPHDRLPSCRLALNLRRYLPAAPTRTNGTTRRKVPLARARSCAGKHVSKPGTSEQRKTLYLTPDTSSIPPRGVLRERHFLPPGQLITHPQATWFAS